MANYNFSMFTVLVVEDNRYMRSMLRTLLYALGVENVVTAAKHALKTPAKAPTKR